MMVNEEKKIGVLREEEFMKDPTSYSHWLNKAFKIVMGLNQVIVINKDGTFRYYKNRGGPTGPFEPTQEQLELMVELLM